MLMSYSESVMLIAATRPIPAAEEAAVAEVRAHLHVAADSRYRDTLSSDREMEFGQISAPA